MFEKSICPVCANKNDTKSFFCPDCGSLQEWQSYNHFDLFNLPSVFDLDTNLVKEKYFALQKMLHPDRFIDKNNRDKLLALDYSIKINNAYKTLLSPVKRAIYLLLLKGIDISEEAKLIKPSVELLEDIMQQREELSTLISLADLELFEQKQQEIQQHLLHQFTKYFDQQDFTLAAEQAIGLRYGEKILEEIKLKKSVLK
jgi:molecular chaperone HscB